MTLSLSLSLVQAHKQFHRQAVQVKRPKHQKSVRDLQCHLVMCRKFPSQPRITSTEHQIVSWPDICSTRTICKKFMSIRGSKIWQGETGKGSFLPYLHAIIHIGFCKFFTPTECSTTWGVVNVFSLTLRHNYCLSSTLPFHAIYCYSGKKQGLS